MRIRDLEELLERMDITERRRLVYRKFYFRTMTSSEFDDMLKAALQMYLEKEKQYVPGADR